MTVIAFRAMFRKFFLFLKFYNQVCFVPAKEEEKAVASAVDAALDTASTLPPPASPSSPYTSALAAKKTWAVSVANAARAYLSQQPAHAAQFIERTISLLVQKLITPAQHFR